MTRLYDAVRVLSAAGLVLLASTACRPVARRQPTDEVPSAVVGRTDIEVAITAAGRVEPVARADLAFEGAGRVSQVMVQEGDVIEAGAEVARLETESLVIQIEQAQATLLSAQARLAQLQAGPREDELAARIAGAAGAQAQVEAARANLDQLLSGVSRAQIAAAEAELAAAQAEHVAAVELHERTMTCKNLTLPSGEKTTICPALGPVEEQARLNREAAYSKLVAAQARLDEVLGGADSDAVRAARANVETAEAQWEAAQAQVDSLLAGVTSGEIAAAQAQVDQAEVSLAQAQLSLEGTRLHSPIAGVVAAVNVVPGEAPPVGRPAVSIVDTSRLRVSFSVDELDVGLLAEGQVAEVTTDALPGAVIEGVVSRVAPAAGLEGGVVSYDALADLEPTEVPLRVDMSANVVVTVDELVDALVVPTWAVRIDRLTGQTYVERRAGGQLERVDVELGVRREGLAEVLDGLSEGDVVVRAAGGGAFSLDLDE